MTKKSYVKPTIEIISMQSATALLSDSSDPWWKEPETPPGCQSAWWCGPWKGND